MAAAATTDLGCASYSPMSHRPRSGGRRTARGSLAELVEMSRRPGFDKLAAVVWPETAPPLIVEPGSPRFDYGPGRAAGRLSPHRRCAQRLSTRGWLWNPC